MTDRIGLPFSLFVVFSLLLGGWALEAPASDSERAGRAMREGNYGPAFCIWERLARAGDPEAQYNLGWMYHNGYGVVIDDGKTLDLWLKAAEQGYVDAQFSIGMLYTLGEGVPRDSASAAAWYGKAALSGHEDARELLVGLATEGVAGASELVTQLVDAGTLGKWVRVRSTKANVRQGPSTATRILGTVEQGTPMARLDTEKKWWHVWIPKLSRFGWVHSSLFEE